MNRAYENSYYERIDEVIQNQNEKVGNKYLKDCKGIKIDVYDVLVAFNVTNPATAHAIKKLLASGQRGYKDTAQDLDEAIESIKRAKELEL